MELGKAPVTAFRIRLHTTFRAKISCCSKEPCTLTSQETREKKQSLSRAALSQLVASRWRHGARAQQPHGSNCIDIETYRIRPKVDVKLLGSQPIHTRLAHISPQPLACSGHSNLQFRIRPRCFWRIWRAVSAATNVQDLGQSQLCLEGSACKCSAGSLANNNIGTCQRVSEFMNRFFASCFQPLAEICRDIGSNCLQVFGAS